MKRNYSFTRSRKGSSLIILIAIAGIVLSMVAVSTAKVMQTVQSSLLSTKIATQSEQLAKSKMSLMAARAYTNLFSQSKQAIPGLDFYDEVIVGAETVDGNVKGRQVQVNVYYKNNALPYYTLRRNFYSAEDSSAGFVGWIDNFPASGVAPYDGIMTISSGWNGGITVTTSGVIRIQVHGRSKYGQGYVSACCPLKKGETYSVSGGRFIRFMRM